MSINQADVMSSDEQANLVSPRRTRIDAPHEIPADEAAAVIHDKVAVPADAKLGSIDSNQSSPPRS